MTDVATLIERIQFVIRQFKELPDIRSLFEFNTWEQEKRTNERLIHPNLGEGYARCIREVGKLNIHYDSETSPLRLLHEKSPNQPDEEFKYQVENFRHWTKPYWMRAVGQIARVLNPQNYSMTVDSDEITEYVTTTFPTYMSLHNFYLQTFLSKKFQDPNAVKVTKPRRMPVIEKDGQLMLDDTAVIEPINVIYPCAQVMEFVEDEYVIILIDEKSIVNEGDRKVREGMIFEIYDTDNIWRVSQEGEFTDLRFGPLVQYYNHNLGFLPAERLKGTPITQGTALVYESYFANAAPNLDTALKGYSDLSTSVVGRLFLERVEFVDSDCVRCGGDKRIEHTLEDGKTTEWAKCPDCDGTGIAPKSSALNTKFINTGTDGGEALASVSPTIFYPQKDVAPLDFTYTKIQNELRNAFLFVNLDVTTDTASGTETATGKLIDREDLFSFLTQVSSEVFASMDLSLRAIIGYMSTNTAVAHTLNPPRSFAIRSEEDLMLEIEASRKAGLPSVAIQPLITELVRRRFPSQEIANQAIETIIFSDRLFTVTPETKDRKNDVTAETWEIILSESIMTFIPQALTSDPLFFSKTLEQRKDKLKEMAVAVETELNKDIVTAIGADTRTTSE